MNLVGQNLTASRLRFNSASTYATSDYPIQGIKNFGPYDAALFPKERIRCAIIFPKYREKEKNIFKEVFLTGEENFDGFERWFRVKIKFTDERPIINETSEEINRVAKELSTTDCDVVFVLTTKRNTEVYRRGKATLLGNGIPNQFVILEKFINQYQRQWIISNIALATYAKVGGTPWVVASSANRNEIIMGVSRAEDKLKRFIVGFVTLFNQNGDFLFLYSQSPVVEWEKYVEGLKNLVTEAFDRYIKLQGVPSSLIIHFHKRPGYRELEAVNDALKEVNSDIPYALLHLNEFSSFHLFDTSHNTYVPQSGLKVELSHHRALLLLDGRFKGKSRSRMGVPNVLDITMDKRSTISASEFPRLVQQVYNFSRVNWRGFNARSIPVTLNYSYLISRLVVEVGIDNWNQIIGCGKLRDKAWFL